jgi:hypothetical protein
MTGVQKSIPAVLEFRIFLQGHTKTQKDHIRGTLPYYVVCILVPAYIVVYRPASRISSCKGRYADTIQLKGARVYE